MKFLAVHPSALMYSKVFLRLEPLGLELVTAAVIQLGHEAKIIDLQVESHQDYFRLLKESGRSGRAIDNSTEEFVNETLMGI